MLYNISTLKSSLYQVLGFQQDYRTEYINIDSQNLVSTSGRYYNEFHSLITSENLYAIYPESENASPHHDFNDWLRIKVKASIAKAIDAVFRAKRPQVKQMLGKYLLYQNPFDLSDKVTKSDRWVGFSFRIQQGRNMKVTLKQIAAAFDTTENITLYLFHSSQVTPVSSYAISAIANTENWQSGSVTLQFDNGDYKGGTWYLVYLESALTGQAINRHYPDSDVMNTNDYIEVSPVYATNNTAVLPDLDDITTPASETYGLNFEIVIEADLTNFIVDMKKEFANVIGLQFAYDFLEEMYYCNRNNEVERRDRQTIFIELKGTDTNKTIGLEYKLQQAINEMDFDISALDPVFFPVRDKFPMTGL